MSLSLGNFLGQTLTAITTFQYYTTAAIVLFYYEYLITFGREVRFAWKNRCSYMSVMFLSLRYITFLAYIPTLLFEASAPTNNNACVAFARFPGAINTVSLGIITIFLVLRTYALYFRRPWILVVIVPLGIINVVLAAWSLTKVKTLLFSFGTGELHACVPELLLSKTPFKASWSITIAFDTIISVLTISKTYRMHRENRRAGIESRLTGMLLHDGSIYCSVMTVANVLNFILFWAENFNFIEAGAGNSSEITHSISVIIVSRMMVNIMEAADPHAGYNHEDSNNRTENGPKFSTLRFPTQFSVVTGTTSLLGPSIQRPSEYSHEGSSTGKGTMIVETVEEAAIGIMIQSHETIVNSFEGPSSTSASTGAPSNFEA